MLIRLARRIRREEGFGLIELTIALVMLAIGISALGGLFISGNYALRRASKSDTAAVLADKLFERFRAQKWDSIGLSNALFQSVDATYKSDPAYSDSVANGGTAVTVTDPSDPCYGSAPLYSVCYPSRTAPDSFDTTPDSHQYRIDTYINWDCSTSSDHLDTSVSPPVCKTSGGVEDKYSQVKRVTPVVRDPSSNAEVYRTSTTFDRLAGGSMPTVTVSPTTGSTATTSTTSGTTTSASGAPDAPVSVAFANGGGTNGNYININNYASLSFDVQLDANSLATDSITLTMSDGNPLDDYTAAPHAATAGAGLVHFTGATAAGLADGNITISVTASNASGTSTETTITVVKDTGAPDPPTSVSLQNGQGTGNAYINSSTKSAVSIGVGVDANSVTTDTVSVSLSDGSNSTSAATASATAGAGSITLTGINAASLSDGTVTATATVTDQAGNTSSGTINTSPITKDATAPTLTMTNASGTASNQSSVQWTATFGEPVTGVLAADFDVVVTGLSGNPKVTALSGSGATYTVTAGTGNGDGTLTLKLISAGTIKDAAGNAISAPVTGSTYTIDRTPPTLTITRAGSSPTNQANVSWTVTFSESVTGLAVSNFTLVNSGLSGPAISGVSGSGSSWTVTASVGTGTGTLGLNLTSAGSLKDLAGNAPSTPVTGASYSVDHAPPTLTITRVTGTPTNASSLQWTVTFSKSVTGVVAGDFSVVAGAGITGTPAVTGVSGSGTTYTVTASTGGGNGTLGLNLTSAGTIQDSAGNAPATPVTGQTYTLDRTAPTVTVTIPVNGASSVAVTGPFAGTANDTTTVTVKFCQAATWTCGSSPDATATATLVGGNWSVTLPSGSKLKSNSAYVVRASQTDAAGNTGTSADVSFHT